MWQDSAEFFTPKKLAYPKKVSKGLGEVSFGQNYKFQSVKSEHIDQFCESEHKLFSARIFKSCPTDESSPEQLLLAPGQYALAQFLKKTKKEKLQHKQLEL